MSSPSIRDWPGYWFILLEKLLAAGDFDGVSYALNELNRLGYIIAKPLVDDKTKGAGRD